MNPATRPDETMTAITAAVQHGRDGNPGAARTQLLALWDTMGPLGDPLHRCTLAHFLADLQDDAAQALIWDVRALDAAGALTDERTHAHHPTLRARGFHPSLHLNLADNLRRLGSFEAADRHLDAAREYFDALGHDPYGDGIRNATDEVAAAVRARSTAPRASAPDGRS